MLRFQATVAQYTSKFFVPMIRHAIVIATMRTRYDQFGKQMVRSVLEDRGPVETDTEVPADTRRIDLWFMPDPARRSPAPDHLGLLGRIAGGPSTLEFFHNTPSGDELAACSVLKHAILELQALQAEAPERTLALPILLRLRLAVPSDPAKQTDDDQEFLMDTQDIVETWRREAIQQGIKEALIDVYEARFGGMPEDLRAVVDDMHDELTLRTWAKLAGTRSADEVAATLRRSRPS